MLLASCFLLRGTPIAQSLLAEVFYCLVPSTDGVLPGRFLLSKAQLAQPCYSTEFLRDLLGSIIGFKMTTIQRKE